ncbi:DUF742 domain-containing protein [Actinacidiphila yeochonensis]|uniref:DUF742 domain-containing protein n=1 Tax=Actinacidiphila yeochonensis TaxID=89050 RepID=UPI00055CFDEF|nr:DUF742 domain-containing protein [Actinacidiphila yeochonensis]
MTSDEWVDEAAGPVVRPYAVVRGRTSSGEHTLDLVAFVITVTDAGVPWMNLQPEHSAILELCRTPRTVTEVAALMHIPLGVVRVLLGDLLDVRVIRIREPEAAASGRPNVRVIEEVLAGLMAL